MKICIALLTALIGLASGVPVSNAQQESVVHVGIERVFPKLRFDRPVFLTGAGDGSGRIFVVEQDGVIRVFHPGEEPESVDETSIFLDLRQRISRKGNEEGLIGLAFHPDFESNGQFFVHYSSSENDMTGIVARFHVSREEPGRADPASEEIVLQQKQPYRNHNGGTIAFGPEGFLYISFGDGGKANDPHDHGQNVGSWLGAILRIDVNRSEQGRSYAVPGDNPFVDTPGALPELWAIGLRNVWRFSFDRKTGELWAGDVGQDRFDEVSLIKRGGNYGWNRFEANADFKADARMATKKHDPPVAAYGRQWGLSVTGGNVYRGTEFPQLQGSYFYGDYVSGNLWRIQRGEDGVYKNELVRRTGRSIASFGEDDEGELYLLSFDGGIYRVVPSDQPERTFDDWPEKLSETGIYASTQNRELAESLIPYSVNAPFWSDSAEKSRYLMLPAGEKLGYRSEGAWDVPVGATIVKNFRQPGGRMLETRLIKRTDEGWEAATYVWNARPNDDATLHPEGQQFETYTVNREQRQWTVDSWHAPSASECAACHVDAAGYVLALNTLQLNREIDGKNQIREWSEKGWLDLPADFDADKAGQFCSPNDPASELDQRARVYLDVNCSMCHRPGGPGNANIDLRYTTALDKMRMVNEPPAQGDLGISNALIVAPGKPDGSLLLHRMETLGAGRMPNIGSNQIDQAGVQLIREWIESGN